MTSRIDCILRQIEKTGKGLEVGPSYNPVAPKSEGWNIDVADYLDAENLRSKYAAWNVDGSKIETVDHVIGPDGLFATIGLASEYDFIIASHVIEHTVDFIGFLQDCEKMLKSGGILSLAVPDKRYCFDILKPLSTTGQVLEAHLDGRKRHSLGTIFDAHAMHVSRGGEIVFPDNGELDGLTFMHSVQQAADIMNQYKSHAEYMDVHAWHFTLESFELIITDLASMKFISFEILETVPTLGYEFFISIRKTDAVTNSLNRMALMKDAFRGEMAAKQAPST